MYTNHHNIVKNGALGAVQGAMDIPNRKQYFQLKI
jgi:hypothetical protein